MNDNKFTTGLLVGLILGGGAVFLLGTRTGKNVLKIVSEQGLDGLLNLLEEYNLNGFVEEMEEVTEGEAGDQNSEVLEKKENGEPEKSSKKHFFRRVKK
jgi:hypothetical protein